MPVTPQLATPLVTVHVTGGRRAASAHVRVDAPHLDFTFTLEDGTHTVRTAPTPIGSVPSLGGRRLMASFAFEYTYDAVGATVTVCGPTYPSSGGMVVITEPEGTGEICRHYAAPGIGFPAEDGLQNRYWQPDSQLMAPAGEALGALAVAASEALITALSALPGIVVRIREPLPALSADDYLQLAAVVRGGSVSGPFELGGELGPDDAVRIVESVYGGIAVFDDNEAFANVEGSTDDPRVEGKPWVRLWEGKTGRTATICTSFGVEGFTCSGPLKGGHVVRGELAMPMPRGSDDVYIFPICTGHNNDDNVYMEAIQYTTAVWLKNYLGR